MAKKEKKTAPSLDKTWRALKGKDFRRRISGRTTPKKSYVEIVEYGRSVTIPPDTDADDPYGIPVTAKLAINLISDFHSLLNNTVLKKFIDGKDIKVNFENKDLLLEIEKSVNDLVDLLRRSCAITIDKPVLLKTLSQPGCEGIRFYMCKKSTELQDDLISLVTVGVDKDGKDHLYEYNKRTAPQAVQDTSLLSEYGHPPGGTSVKDKKLEQLYGEQYPLLNYALDLTRSKR